MLLKAIASGVCLACLAGTSIASANWLAVDVSFASPASGRSGSTTAGPSSLRVASADPALLEEASRQLMGASTAAMEMQRKRDQRRVVLESSHFRRGAGKVHAVGIFWDGRGPRPLQMYVDAWGPSGVVVASYPFNFTSTGNRQRLEAVGIDDPSFVKFSFRFADGGEKLEISSVPESSLDVVPVSPSAMLFHSDYGELREHLEDGGYIEGESFEPAALLGPVKRFRSVHGLNGPEFITLLDLFALREAVGAQGEPVSMGPYVDWASSVGGGRAVERPTYQPVTFEDGFAYLLDD